MGKGIPIHVLGTSFTIQTDESPEYVRTLVDYVTDKITVLEKSISTKDTVRLALLASILITDELFKERQLPGSTISEDGERIGHLTDHIIARLNDALDGHAGNGS